MSALDKLTAYQRSVVINLQAQQGWTDEGLKDLIRDHARYSPEKDLVEYLQDLAHIANNYMPPMRGRF